MRGLMIAPHVFFSQRGTPYSAFLKLKALSGSGLKLDLATYPFGDDVKIKGVRIFRCGKPPFINSVKQGPSLKKLILDMFLAGKIISLMRKERYDFLYTHEEMGLFGAMLRRLTGIKLVHEMHSSLPVEIEERKFSRLRPVVWLFTWIEKVLARNSDIVVVHCQNLVDIVRRINPSADLVLIENYSDVSIGKASRKKIEGLRKSLGIRKGEKVVLYTGSFANVNNLPMLLEAAVIARKRLPQLRLLLVGGEKHGVKELRDLAGRLGLEGSIILEKVAPPELDAFFSLSDALVSPRFSGINIPFKIFSYLESGIPIVAPRSVLYNSFLDESCAVLTEPTREGLAEGMLAAATDIKLRKRMTRGAKKRAGRYSYKNYISNIRRLKQKIDGWK